MTQLRLCLDRCRQARLSLNPAKCAFLVTNGNLLGHIFSQGGIAMDPDKVKAILNAPAPSNAKALSRFLGQIRWHSRMIRDLADFATPLHAVVHRLPFQWTSVEDTTLSRRNACACATRAGPPGSWTRENFERTRMWTQASRRQSYS